MSFSPWLGSSVGTPQISTPLVRYRRPNRPHPFAGAPFNPPRARMVNFPVTTTRRGPSPVIEYTYRHRGGVVQNLLRRKTYRKKKCCRYIKGKKLCRPEYCHYPKKFY